MNKPSICEIIKRIYEYESDFAVVVQYRDFYATAGDFSGTGSTAVEACRNLLMRLRQNYFNENLSRIDENITSIYDGLLR